MKVILDTNIYISWIRESKHPDLLLNPYTQKYLSAVVLMELWAGAKTKASSRIIDKLQNPYIKARRIVTLKTYDFIKAGQIISDMPDNYKNKIKMAGFTQDIYIALTAITIGATLYTENKKDFQFIQKYLQSLKAVYI